MSCRPCKLILVALLLVAGASGNTCLASAGAVDHAAERAAMVTQLRRQGIRNGRVLVAMGRVPRHLFFAQTDSLHAYHDCPLSIGSGRVAATPYAVALMTQLIAPQPGMRVLQVGIGSGYHSAVLADITRNVFVIDVRPTLTRAASTRLRARGYSSVRCHTGSACRGWPEHAPYDAIVVTCATERVPVALIEQLREGGRLVITIGRGPEQTLNCLRKSGGRLRAEAGVRLQVSATDCGGQ